MAANANSGKYLVIGGLLLLLLVFPIVSWYYLRTGLDYRVTALGELGQHGQLPGLAGSSFFEDSLSNKDLRGKVVVTSFIPSIDEAAGQLYGENLGRLHDQFDEREDVVFVNYLADTDNNASRIAAYAEKYDLGDKAQVWFLQTNERAMNDLAEAGFHLPAGLLEAPVFVLADTSGTIRNYYDASNPEEVKRMVEHVALILPYQGRPKPVVKREKEK